MTDLTAESRRQLKPLGKQAEIARRAQTVQAESHDARLRHPLTEPGMGCRFEV